MTQPVRSTRAMLEAMADETPFVFAEGYDEAILGTAEVAGENVVAYDVDAIIQILETRDGMSNEEAEEFFDYNVAGAYICHRPPIFVRILTKIRD